VIRQHGAMPIAIECTDDAHHVLARAGAFLAGEPVRHNLVQTILADRARSGEPGRYWLAVEGDAVIGLALQSPLDFFATATPIPDHAVVAMVDTIVEQGIGLPGVNAEAAVAARFAGHWTERTRSAARPVGGGRIYAVAQVVAPTGVSGRVRVATDADRALLMEWTDAFVAEARAPMSVTTDRFVDLRTAAHQLWIWEADGAVAYAGRTAPVGGAVRIGPVYTPPASRGCGYASALVAAMSTAVLDDGHACLLYTDLENPTSNGIYRALGYEAVAETMHYDFATPSS